MHPKVAQIVKRVGSDAIEAVQTRDLGKGLGVIAAGAAIAAHPIIGTALAPKITEGTEAVVNNVRDRIRNRRES